MLIAAAASPDARVRDLAERTDLSERGVLRILADLESAGVERALLVAHGGLIIGLTGHLLGMPAASWGALIGVGNCHWVVLDRHHEGWRLRSYNAGLSGVVFSLAEDDAEG